jgi:hypothetical protein
MKTILITIIFFLITANAALAVRIKDIAGFDGARDNQLIGYGLVVGLNGSGELGDGTLETSLVPVTVQNVGGGGALGNVVDVSSDERHVLALLADGTVRAWGGNEIRHSATVPPAAALDPGRRTRREQRAAVRRCAGGHEHQHSYGHARRHRQVFGLTTASRPLPSRPLPRPTLRTATTSCSSRPGPPAPSGNADGR